MQNGVQPIAVGEVNRHLMAKCIARETNSETVEICNKKQWGVAVKVGTDIIVHATRIAFNSSEKLQKPKNSGILQTDVKSASNSVNRNKVLESVAKF